MPPALPITAARKCLNSPARCAKISSFSPSTSPSIDLTTHRHNIPFNGDLCKYCFLNPTHAQMHQWCADNRANTLTCHFIRSTCSICLSRQIANWPNTWLHCIEAWRHGQEECWRSTTASEWGRKKCVTLKMALLFQSSRLAWALQEQLLFWEIHAQSWYEGTSNSNNHW